MIIGGGPAGLCAALYAGRGLLKTVLLERGVPGGELLNTEWIEDYPGFKKIKGRDLAQAMTEHAQEFGAEIRQENVESIVRRESDGSVRGDDVARRGVRGAGGHPHRGRHAEQARRARRAGVRRSRRFLLRGLRRGVLQGRDDCRRGWRRRRRGGSRPTSRGTPNGCTSSIGGSEFRASKLLQERLFANPKIEVHLEQAGHRARRRPVRADIHRARGHAHRGQGVARGHGLLRLHRLLAEHRAGASSTSRTMPRATC